MHVKSLSQHRSATPLHLAMVAAVALAIGVSGRKFSVTEPSTRSATRSALAPSYPSRISVEEQSATAMLLHEAWTEAAFGRVLVTRDTVGGTAPSAADPSATGDH